MLDNWLLEQLKFMVPDRQILAMDQFKNGLHNFPVAPNSFEIKSVSYCFWRRFERAFFFVLTRPIGDKLIGGKKLTE